MRISMDASGFKKKQHDKKYTSVRQTICLNVWQILIDSKKPCSSNLFPIEPHKKLPLGQMYSTIILFRAMFVHYFSWDVLPALEPKWLWRRWSRVVEKKTKNLTKNKARKQIRKTIDILDMLKWLFHRL